MLLYNTDNAFFSTSLVLTKIPIKERIGPMSFQRTKLACLPPGKHRVPMQDILLSPPLLTKPREEESVIKMKPPRTFVEAECRCQGGLRPSHRNQHFCPEKLDEILLDKWPDPQTYIPFKSYYYRYALHHSFCSVSEESMSPPTLSG